MTPDVRLGLFTCADTIGQQQLDAWGSWRTMPGCAVSVFGDVPLVADHANRFGFRSIPAVERDEFGRPSLAWIFARMHDESAESVLGYVNSDIILLPGLVEGIAAVRSRFDSYLIVARRWNVERLSGIDFDAGWDKRVRQEVARKGELSTPYGIDLFVFSRGLLEDVPAFALGSDYWDNYLVMRARRQGVPVVDVTRQVMLVHQDHSLGTYRSRAERRRGPEGLRAFALAGDSHALLGQTGDATHVVDRGLLTRAETVRVTAVIPHAGDPRRLCRCLRALEYQTYPQSFLTAIVVNRDPEAPLRYLEADFPSVRVLVEPWSEPATARNKGISSATGDVVALFDSDVDPAAECLGRAMRVLKDCPECDVVVCRVVVPAPSAGSSYVERVVGWCDAVPPSTPSTGAWVVRKSVFGRSGYFSRLMPGESDLREWLGRAIGDGVKVARCHDAVVRRETVRRLADLKHKRQGVARNDCIVESLKRNRECGAFGILRGEWREVCRRSSLLWHNPRLSWPDRAGALLLTAWSSVWTVRAKVAFRHDAWRLARRRRREIYRPGLPEATGARRPPALVGRDADARRLAGRIARPLGLRRRRLAGRPPSDALTALPRRDLFTAIYDRGLWGRDHGDIFSGDGSDGAVADRYCVAISGFIRALGRPSVTVVDIGCGDFRVGRRLLAPWVRYIGVDIVPALIARNTRLYGGDSVEFVCLDAVDEDPPDGDVCLVRQVFQHLSNDDIEQMLGRLTKYPHLFVTEHCPASDVEVVPNLDKPTGPAIRLPRSGVYLEAPPFNLAGVRPVLTVPAPGGGVLRTVRISQTSFPDGASNGMSAAGLRGHHVAVPGLANPESGSSRDF